MVHHLSRAPARTERLYLAPVKRIRVRHPNSTRSDDFLQHFSNEATSVSGPPLVRSRGGQIFLTGMLVNQTEDKCQHDRTSSLGREACCRSSFLADFALQGKRLRPISS